MESEKNRGGRVGRPSKPVAVIEAEGKSHRTQAELECRKAAEDAVLSHEPLFERAEVRRNKLAHAEFKRVAKLMDAIGKNDALYSSGLNTYCLLYAEIAELEEEKGRIRAMIDKLSDKAEAVCDAEELVQAMKAIDKMLGKVLSVGTTIDQKRRLMLAIDKENVMTVSAALRSIPKTPEKEVNPILAALSDEE